MSDNSAIAFFLYDIVTATDAAGNPTKLSNFEFFYTLSGQSNRQTNRTSHNVLCRMKRQSAHGGPFRLRFRCLVAFRASSEFPLADRMSRR